MKTSALFTACLAAIVATMAALLAIARNEGREIPNELPGDPALAYYTSSHNDHYGGIDRWATYGMRVELLAATLGKVGYACQAPREQVEVQPLTCTRQLAWPKRTLTIEASIDYRQRGRLVSATARSDIVGQWGQRVGNWMRNYGWIEPQTLQVRGFDFSSVDLLEKIAADAIRSGGWYEHCMDEVVMSNCPAMASARRQEGFPALQAGFLPVGGPADVQRLMEQVRMMPVVVRGADNHPDDSLLVRVQGSRMWLDFAGRDLSGRVATVSVALDSIGGTPVELIAAIGGESRALKLAGSAKLDNGGAKIFLLPEAGDLDTTFAHWMVMPNQNYPGTFAKLGPALLRTHPDFLAGTVQAVIAKILTHEQPEDSLGLYPLLHTIEERAAALRQADIASAMPSGMAERIVLEAYQGQPALRISWAMAKCQQGVEHDCLQRLVRSDPEAAALLRAEVATLSAGYASLASNNPIRVHLKQLGDALQ